VFPFAFLAYFAVKKIPYARVWGSQKLLLPAAICRKKLGMIISKLTPFLCALAIGATGLTVRAEDNPAQAAARMALAKQLFEMSGQPAANTVDTNVVTKPLTKKEAKAKAKADQAAADANAKQEADKQLAEQQAAHTAAQANANKAVAEVAAPGDAGQKEAAERAALAAAMAPGTNTAIQATTSASVTPAATDATAKKEKKKKKDAAAVQPAAVPPSTSATTNYIGQELGMKQLAGPALPISATKVERLQALLDKYKADQLTPEEYHQQRAAILAEP